MLPRRVRAPVHTRAGGGPPSPVSGGRLWCPLVTLGVARDREKEGAAARCASGGPDSELGFVLERQWRRRTASDARRRVIIVATPRHLFAEIVGGRRALPEGEVASRTTGPGEMPCGAPGPACRTTGRSCRDSACSRRETGRAIAGTVTATHPRYPCATACRLPLSAGPQSPIERSTLPPAPLKLPDSGDAHDVTRSPLAALQRTSGQDATRILSALLRPCTRLPISRCGHASRGSSSAGHGRARSTDAGASICACRRITPSSHPLPRIRSTAQSLPTAHHSADDGASERTSSGDSRPRERKRVMTRSPACCRDTRAGVRGTSTMRLVFPSNH